MNCAGTVYQGPIALGEDPGDSCRFTNVLTEEAFGTATLMTVAAPDDVSTSPDEFSLEIGTVPVCVDPGAVYVDWDGDPVATSYLADYDAAACDNACAAVTPELNAVVTEVEFCDANGDYPGAPAGPPPPPAEPPFRYQRSGHAYSGRFTYAVLDREGSRVCALLRWRRTPQTKARLAVVLANETVVGATSTYQLVDQAGLLTTGVGATATTVAAGTTRSVSGTSGNADWDAYYGLDEEVTFARAIGPGAGFKPGHLSYGHAVCANLKASNP